MKVDVVDLKGKKVKDVNLNEKVFKREINEPLVHQVVVAEMAGMRQGSASTKTRSEIRGGGVKPWRQKGTGRARAGSIRSPLWVGGGITFGPQPKSYKKRIPRKMRKEALKSALSAKLKNSEIVIINKIDIKEPKTKKAVELLKGLNLNGRTTILMSESNEVIEKSFRNLEKVKVIHISQISTYEILNNKKLVITNDAAKKLTEVLSG